MKTVVATRYVAPIRKASSLPGIVDADDGRRYVVKFHGFGQGAHALISELIVATFAEAAQIAMPEQAFVLVGPRMIIEEIDPEVLDVVRPSDGLNFGFLFLEPSRAFDPKKDAPSTEIASRIVALDAFVMNVDRTPKNPNILIVDDRLVCIDHGAALLFEYAADDAALSESAAYVRSHVLKPWATTLPEEGERLRAFLRAPGLIAEIIETIPEAWFLREPPGRKRSLVRLLEARVAAWDLWMSDAASA
ncbi:MAG: HipA family kinase [Polyangiaceae bacterium]